MRPWIQHTDVQDGIIDVGTVFGIMDIAHSEYWKLQRTSGRRSIGMRRLLMVSSCFVCSILVVRPLVADPESRAVLPAKTAGAVVSPETMQAIYERVKTPFKYGVVLRQDGKKVDCPSVFRHDNRWHMLYIVFDGSGYETHIAVSDDLLHWEQQGQVLSTTPGTWDAVQKAGFVALQDYTWCGDYHVENSPIVIGSATWAAL